MIKRIFVLCLLSILIACNGNQKTRSSAILDAESYVQEGVLAYSANNWRQAKQLFTQALSRYQSLDDQQGVLLSHINLAEVALSMRDYQASQLHLNQAAAIADKVSFTKYQPRIKLLQGQQALQKNEIDLAESLIQELLPEFNEVTALNGVDSIQLAAIVNRTRLAFMQNENESLWLNRFAKALEQSPVENVGLEARLLRFQSSLLQKQHHFDEAESKLKLALSWYKNSAYRPGIAATLYELALLAMEQKNKLLAEDYFNRALRVYHHLEDVEKVRQVNNSLNAISLSSKMKSEN